MSHKVEHICSIFNMKNAHQSDNRGSINKSWSKMEFWTRIVALFVLMNFLLKKLAFFFQRRFRRDRCLCPCCLLIHQKFSKLILTSWSWAWTFLSLSVSFWSYKWYTSILMLFWIKISAIFQNKMFLQFPIVSYSLL